MIKKFATSLSVLALVGWSGMAAALPVISNGANNSIGTAQSIDGFFDLSFNAQIEDNSGVNSSTTIPHAEIFGTGDDTYDWFSFIVAFDNSTVNLDIDCGRQYLIAPQVGCDDKDDTFDPVLDLFTIGGASEADNDDDGLDTGSENTFVDSYISTALDAGTYAVRVSDFIGEIPEESTYFLNVSIDPPQTVPAPGILALFGIALLALRRTSRHSSNI